jgi:DNA (cytosine-5)-methyltransferase 1
MERAFSPISVEDAAASCGLTAQQIRSLCRDGKVLAKKIGKIWLVDSNSIEKIKSSSSVGNEANCTRKIAPAKDKPIALSFFSGAMGLDIGLEQAGIQTVLCSEIDSACRKTIKKNRPDVALIGDIRNYTAKEILDAAGVKKEDIDIVVGGPPCQAFSTAGKRLGLEDERGNVFLKYLEIIKEIRPKYAIIENVRGLLSAPLKHIPKSERNGDALSEEEKAGGVLKYILSVLKNAGYAVSFNLYNAANFGSPQKRERVVFICSRDGKIPPYLVPTNSEDSSFNLPKWKTLREAIGNLKCEHKFIPFPEKRLFYYRMLKAGQNWKALPLELQKKALGGAFNSGGGKSGFLRRLAWDEPSPTLVTHPAMPATDLAHPVENRPLSVQEYKKIQEFPDNWQIEGSLLEQYKQIGNAVPISLAKAIGKMVVALLNKQPIQTIKGFKYSRYKGTSNLDWNP